LSLTESVRKALEKRGITVEAIRDVLYKQSVAEGKAYMENVLQKAADIQIAATVQEALATVTSRSSLNFLDYSPLEHLIKSFNLEEVEEELEKYKIDLQQLFMQLMRETPPDGAPPPRKKSRVGPEPEVRREHCTTT